MTHRYGKEVEIGRTMARRAGELALRYWGKVAYDDKADDSPVTVADRESERLIAGMIEENFPDDGLLGEEGARKESRNGRRWIIDPVDGTRDFVRGNPVWAVLIGFEVEGAVEAGFAFLPALGSLFHAHKSAGAYRNDAPIRSSGIDAVERSVLCVNGLNAIHKLGFASRLPDWMRRFWAVRSMGGAMDAMMVASGQAEVWIEPSAQPWDLAPLKVIAEEAGARFFNFDGGSSIYGGNCVVCAPGLEAEARALAAP